MIFIGSILLLIVVSIGYKVSFESDLRNHFWPAIGIKILAGVFLGLIYTYYYPSGDTWSLFDNAQKLNATGFSNFESFTSIFINSNYGLVEGFSYANEPRSALMVKFLAMLLPICGGNYWLLSAYCSAFSFWGLWKLSNALVKLGCRIEAVTIAIFYFPSVVFWSSGIIKESVMMGLLGHIVAIVITVYQKQRIIGFWQLTIVLVCWWFLFSIKYYYGATLAIAIFLLFYFKWLGHAFISIYSKIGITIIVYLFLFFGASSLHPNLNPSNILSVIVNNHYEFVSQSDSENLVQLYKFEPTAWSFIINTPISLISGLYLPLFHINSIFDFLIIIENVLLVLLTLFMLQSQFDKKNKKWGLISIIGVFYIVFLATLLPMAAPNYGTLVRYKVGYLPFLILLLIQSSPKVQAFIKNLNSHFATIFV